MNYGKLIAITGQSGCGKSTLSDFYRSKGFTVIDCDEVAKLVHSNSDCLEELKKEYGNDVVSEGVLDKKLLSSRAFASAEKLAKLTDITHPYILKEILLQRENAFLDGEEIVFVDGAVIIGGITEKHIDEFIIVVVSENEQIKRLMMRDHITEERVKARINGQVSYADMLRKADYVINNNKDLSSFIVQGEFILQQILKKNNIQKG